MKTCSVPSVLSGATVDLSNNPIFNKLVGSDKIQPVISELVKKWESPSRFYHSVENHLLPMLWDIKNMSIDEHSRDLLKIIAWFHDCIYDPKSTENELNSVKFFNENLKRDREVDRENANVIREVIKFTRDFKRSDIDRIKDHFVGLDLSYFSGTDAERTVRNELLMLKEFQFVDYSIYKQRRIKVLEGLRNSQCINWVDASAISNVCKYLESHRPRIGIYPGSFNPFHVGHLSILQEAEKLFDKVIVAMGINPEKQKQVPGPPDRLYNIQEILPYHQVEFFSTFLHEYIKKKSEDADITVIRGFRSGYDIDYELNNLAFIRDMAKDVKIVFIAPQKKFDHISSSAIRLLKGFGEKESKMYIPKTYYSS